MMNIVIIGSGVAGVECAIKCRAIAPDCSIKIFTAENILPYRRPALSKMIAEEIPDQQFFLQKQDFYEQNRIEIYLNHLCTRIDAPDKIVYFDNGNNINFDRLLLATGGVAIIPNIPGTDKDGVFALRQKSDLDQIKSQLRPGKSKVCIVGGGVLGMELADNLLKINCQVYLVEGCSDILPRQLDRQGAQIMQAALEEQNNLSCFFGTQAAEITGKNKVNGITLDSGEHIACDMVIFSIGSTPNRTLSANSALTVKRGIVTDAKLRCSAPDIFAAGDCAEIDGCISGLWLPAKDQGILAAQNMFGADLDYSNNIYGCRLMAFGLKIFSIGNIAILDKFDRSGFLDIEKRIYRQFFWQDGRLCGGILIGDVSDAAKLQTAVNANLSMAETKEMGLQID